MVNCKVDPGALNLAVTVFNAVNLIGMPECRINLALGVIYQVSAPKSNVFFLAINEAREDIKGGTDTTVPLYLRNAPTKLMKNEGYGQGFRYPYNIPRILSKSNIFPIESPSNFTNKKMKKPKSKLKYV